MGITEDTRKPGDNNRSYLPKRAVDNKAKYDRTKVRRCNSREKKQWEAAKEKKS